MRTDLKIAFNTEVIAKLCPIDLVIDTLDSLEKQMVAGFNRKTPYEVLRSILN